MPRSILIVTNRAPWPLQDGGALAMHQLITGYKVKGWAVHLLTMNTRRHWVDEGEIRDAYASLDSVKVIPFDNRVRPLRLLRNLLLSRQPEHAERFYEARFEQALVETVLRVKPDVVQMESLFLTAYLPAIAADSSATLVLRMHNVEHQIWQRAAREATAIRSLYLYTLARRMARYEKWAWNQYHLLLPITTDDAKAVQDAGCRTPLHLTPFGVHTTDLPEPQPTRPTPHTPIRLYHLGAMDWLPNREAIAWFIREAWPQIRRVQPSAVFHFGGRLLEKDFAAPLPPGVFNHGPVGNAAAFAADMDALVVPLRSGGGIRVKILEAMVDGKVVIATGVGIQGIAATRGRHFLRADTALDFAIAVEFLATNPAECFRITTEARALVHEEYDAQMIIARLSERLHQLLQEQR